MKKLALLFLTIALSTTTLFAKTFDEKETVKLRNEIIKLLDNAPFEVEHEINATIDFIVTSKGVIIVTDVKTDTNNIDVETYVKNKLNYKKVTVFNTSRTRFFTMPLKVLQDF